MNFWIFRDQEFLAESIVDFYEKLITIPQLAKTLRCKENEIRRWIEDGLPCQITVSNSGKIHYLLYFSDVYNWLKDYLPNMAKIYDLK